jgi:hypothetical protein
VKGTTVPPTASLDEVPTRAAELIISLERSSPLEAPTPAAHLIIRLEPYDNGSLD